MRKRTSELLELLDNGFITAEEIVILCLKFMTEDDVAEMMDMNQLNEDLY